MFFFLMRSCFLHGWTSHSHGRSNWSIRLALALSRSRRFNRLVDAQYKTRSLGRSRDRVDLDNGRLPHGGRVVVGNVLAVNVHAVPETALGVLLTQLVEYVGGIEAGVLAQLTRYDLERARQRRHDHLLLARDRSRIVAQVLGDLHLDGTAAGHDRVVLERTAHDHDGVVERTLGLLDELLGTAAQNERARFSLRTTREDVVPLAADLLFLEDLARAEHARCQVLHGRLDRAAARFHRSLEILLDHSTGAEHVSVGKVLRGHVADGQPAEHNFGAALVDLLELVVQDLPLGVHDVLILVDRVDADLGVVAFRFQLELDVQQSDQRFLISKIKIKTCYSQLNQIKINLQEDFKQLEFLNLNLLKLPN